MTVLQPWAARVLLAGLLAGAAPATAETISVEEALRRAEDRNPDLKQLAADLQVARGGLSGARLIPFNPEVGVAAGPAFADGQAPLGYDLSLSQTVEVGGKRGHRVDAAQARVSAAELRFEYGRLQLAARVRRAYFLAVVTRSRVSATREAEEVAADLKAAAYDRARLGAGTLLEQNVASSVLGRARRDRLAAERRHREALTELATVTGTAAAVRPEPADAPLPDFGPLTLAEDELVARALARRGDVVAATRERVAAEADAALAGSQAVPDVSLSAVYGRDAIDRANTLLFGLAIPIPVFNRNQGGRAVASAALAKAQIAEATARREAERQARAALSGYGLALDAVRGFDRDVVEKLKENLDLARESVRSGKIGLLLFNSVRRDLVDTRLAYLDALSELVEARSALELAAGGAWSDA
jgi:cobalt-zinc-cadmium efflux system outer membrane protein